MTRKERIAQALIGQRIDTLTLSPGAILMLTVTEEQAHRLAETIDDELGDHEPAAVEQDGAAGPSPSPAVIAPLINRELDYRPPRTEGIEYSAGAQRFMEDTGISPITIQEALNRPDARWQGGTPAQKTAPVFRLGGSQILPTCRTPPDTVWVMKKRYTYRAYPTDGQQQLLARSLGCARAVFNDFVAERDRLFKFGAHREVSFAETGRKVLVESKTTDGARPYLAEVSAAMLQQSVRDAEAGYRNFFASLAGKRRGPKMGPPRLKSKHNHAQRMRFARNAGFTVEDQSHQGHGFLTLPKIGRIRLVMSRSLPSVPSSVTVTAHAGGTYEASFVVEVEPRKEPEPIHAAAGVDAGITSLAAVVQDDGTAYTVANPRHLRTRERKLARAQRALSRKQKGSKNRHKARIQVARQHRKVKVARLDHHHKQARGLVDNTHAIALEDLNVAGMVRNRRLAKALSDAGMSQFLRLIRQKADEAGRTVITVDRWFPSSQLCSECGCPGGKKELAIRQWSCTCCSAVLDRDFNAAKNLMIAAGLAEIENACRGSVRPDPGLAEPTKQEPTELFPSA